MPLFENDNVYVISTFLDPKFGLNAFPIDMKEKIRKCIRKLLVVPENNNLIKEKEHRKDKERSDKYNKYMTIETEEALSLTQKDSKDILIDSFLTKYHVH